MTEAPKAEEPEKEDKTEEEPKEAAKEAESPEVPTAQPTLQRQDTPSPNASIPDETGGQTIEEDKKPEVEKAEESKDEPTKDDNKENEKKEPEAEKEETKEPEAASTTETDASKDSEKSLEEPEKEEAATTQANDTAASDLETAMGTTIATDAEAEDAEPVSKYMLLDRLFKFIRTDEKPLNPVLAGYFSKLTILLINRKQKQIIPYIFGPESDVLDCLLKHIYQKSVAEVLQKLMNIVDTNFDSELQNQI